MDRYFEGKVLFVTDIHITVKYVSIYLSIYTRWMLVAFFS